MEYSCKHCNKQYKSYQSLWIHTKKFHIYKQINVENMSKSMSKNVEFMSKNVENICNIQDDSNEYSEPDIKEVIQFSDSSDSD